MNYNSGYKLGKKNGAGRTPAFTIAFGGVCLALTVICYYLGGIVPGMNLTLYAVGSFFVGLMVLETGISGGLILYAAAGILLFLLMPNKLAMLPYAFFFGPYGIIRELTGKIGAGTEGDARHRRSMTIIRLAIRSAFFLAVFLVGFFCFRELFFSAIKLPDYADVLVVIGGVAMFILYDAMYELLGQIYLKRFKGRKEKKKGPLDDIRLSKDE